MVCDGSWVLFSSRRSKYVRGIPKETIFRLKMAAAAEHRTVKGFLLALIEERIQELERKGMLPEGK